MSRNETAADPTDPTRQELEKEYSGQLIRRSRALLRVLIPLSALLVALLAVGFFPAGRITATDSLVVLAGFTGFIAILMALVEIAETDRLKESSVIRTITAAVPGAVVLGFFLLLAYFAAIADDGLAWGVIYTLGLFSVAGILPLPMRRAAPIFSVFYLSLLLGLFYTDAPGRSVLIAAVAGGIELALGLYINGVFSRRALWELRERRRLKEANSHLTAMVERNNKLLSIVSHDVRGPLGSIVQLFDFVEERREQFSPRELAEMMDDVTASLRNAYQLLDNLLSWARSAAGTVTVDREPHHLNRLVYSALQPVLLAVRRKEIHLTQELDLGLELIVDRRMIEVSLRNFISNAVKFTEPGGRLIIRGSHGFDGGIVIEIIDDGVGMTEKEVRRLLEGEENPISRVGTAGERGSGLGFELARQFIHLNSGTLELKSKPDRGTHITVHLPGRFSAALAGEEEAEQLPQEGEQLTDESEPMATEK